MIDGGNADGASEHEEIRRQVLALRNKADDDSWALASALAQVHAKSYYHGWGFDTWKDYVEKEVDIHIRKAQFLVKIEEWLAGLPKNVSGWVRTLGWTKARMLCGVITHENASEWRARIGTGITVAALDDLLHAESAAAAANPDGPGGDSDPNRQPAFKVRVTPAQRQNIERALEVAARAAGCDTTEDRKGYLLDLVATEYLAGNHGIRTVSDYLTNVENVLGVKLVAFDEAKDEIIHGSDLVERLNAEIDQAESLANEEPPTASTH